MTSKPMDVPESACRLRLAPTAQAKFDESKADESGARPEFSMLAATGQLLSHPWWGNFAVDLDGLKFDQKTPLLLDHDPGRRLGFSTEMEVAEDGLRAKGVLFKTTPDAMEVLDQAREGFPWQASVFIPPSKIEKVEAGASAEVNGFTLEGPGHIFRESTVREITMTALGQDPGTSTEAFKVGPSVTATLEERETEMPEEKPDTTPKAVEQTAEFAAAQERERASFIMAQADADQFDLAKELVENGSTQVEALQAFNADLKRRVASGTKLSEIENASPDPVGSDFFADSREVPATKSEEKPATLEEQWERMSQSARNEFNGEFEIFENLKQKPHLMAEAFGPQADEDEIE